MSPGQRPRASVVRAFVAVGLGVVLVAVGVVLFLRRRHTSPGAAGATAAAAPSRVSGFDQIGFQVRSATGDVARRCGLLAVTTAQQNQGLMHRTDLAGYDGMLFQFPAPTTTEFYMKDTLIDLSIAWFDQRGRFVSETDMPPCGTAAICPLFGSSAPYTIALEVLRGRLPALGVGAGSTIAVGGSC